MSDSNSWLERFGLHRPELRAWALYDWANSAFVLVVITAVFPIYVKNVAAGVGVDNATITKWLSYTTAASLAIVSLCSPVLGAVADFLGRRKHFLALFVGLGSASSAGLFFIHSGRWIPGLVLFAIGNAALFLSFVFYDSLLPHLASEKEIDRVSTAGYAVGYLGSGLLLVVILAAIQKPELFGLADAGVATRVGFLVVGLWWAIFSLPLFKRVEEPPREVEVDEAGVDAAGASDAVRAAFGRLRETVGELRGNYKHAFLMLVAYMIYNEGVGTTIRMGGLYAATKGFPETSIILAILIIQFVGIPFAFLFGALGPKLGTKRAILLGLAVYIGISVVAYNMKVIGHFYVVAGLIAMVQGGTQGLSRSLFASMVPKHKASEMFGFFSIFAKVAGIFGPLLFGLVIEFTGSEREAILSVIVFFVVGGFLLSRVDVEEGQRQARLADRGLVETP
ncbi:MAG: MFS transporter [Acidobacteriota bacterium]